MALIVSEFFELIGVSSTPPQTMAELIPYLLTVVVGLCLVLGVFKVFGALFSLFGYTKW